MYPGVLSEEEQVIIKFLGLLFIVVTLALISFGLVAYFISDDKTKTKRQQNVVREQLGDRMKRYESVYHMVVPKDHVMIVRLDGASFSKWTNRLDGVFDMGFCRSMILTMNDLVLHFHAQTGYTHSDEITLIFAPEESHLYGGRVQKLVSVMAGFAVPDSIII